MAKVDYNLIEKRNVVKFEKVNGIYTNGADNLYPQRIEAYINNSVTAKSAANKMKSFLIGGGFVDETLNSKVVYSDVNGEVTLYDLLDKVSHNISRHNGAICQVQYNGLGTISGVKPLIWRNMRYGKQDSIGYSGLIKYYSNWEKRPNEKYEPKNAPQIHHFNPNKQVVLSQFAKDWLGQVAILQLDDEFIYPLAPIDPAIRHADNEYQMQAFVNSELRKGFNMQYILHHAQFEDAEQYRQFKAKFKEFEGGEHDSTVLMSEGEFDQDGKLTLKAFELEKIERNYNDKIFENWEKSAANNIRKVFCNIPSILIEQQDGGFFGSSGEAFKSAFDLYNSETENIRTKIQQYFKKIFIHHEDLSLANADLTIKKLSYGTVDSSGAANDKTI